MVCAQVMGNDTSVTIAGASGHFELNVYKPIIIYNFLQSARLLGDGALSFTRHCLTGLEPDRQVIADYLEKSLMLVTALNPHIGYDQAAKIAKLAHENDITLKQAALELGILSPKAFDELVIPGSMVGPLGSESKPK